jgi:hypothetical protein
VSVFFVNTQDGRVATRGQLTAAGLVDPADAPVRPWHPIQGPSDASTMWYAVLRKRERGVFIGTLCIRHTGRQASLEERGWEEVPVDAIGVETSGGGLDDRPHGRHAM